MPVGLKLPIHLEQIQSHEMRLEKIGDKVDLVQMKNRHEAVMPSF